LAGVLYLTKIKLYVIYKIVPCGNDGEGKYIIRREHMAEKQEGKSSLGKRLAVLREQRAQGKSVGQILNEAQEGLLYSKEFFGAVADTDTLGIAYLRNVLGYPLPKAAAVWYGKPWKDQLASIAGLGDEVVKRALETFQLFQENELLWQILQVVVDEIGRPSRRIYSDAQFNGFLRDLVFKGLAMELEVPPGWRKSFQWQNRYYTATSLLKARLAWPFVVKALGRVRAYTQVQKEVMPRIQPLLDQATLENNPEEQQLHKLLTFQDQVGTMVIWDANLRMGEEEIGLLAVLIGRMVPASSFVLEGWVADQPLSLPSEEAYELPTLLVYERPVDSGLEVGFQQAQLSKKEGDSIRKIQRLIRRWLGLEGKFRIPALTQFVQQPRKQERSKR